LIGSPQQTDNGFSFRCLLNPRIKIMNPCMMVQLGHSELKQNTLVQGSSPGMIDPEMYGIVIGVDYRGDTRGNDWYCDVTCLSRGGASPLNLDPNMIPSIMKNQITVTA
jgi:hypothetical protein